MLNLVTYTASKARKELYTLIKSASKGLKAYEIRLRGEESVILMSKEELESWMETIDILSNPVEAKAVGEARKEKKTISHKQLLKELGIKNAS